MNPKSNCRTGACRSRRNQSLCRVHGRLILSIRGITRFEWKNMLKIRQVYKGLWWCQFFLEVLEAHMGKMRNKTGKQQADQSGRRTRLRAGCDQLLVISGPRFPHLKSKVLSGSTRLWKNVSLRDTRASSSSYRGKGENTAGSPDRHGEIVIFFKSRRVPCMWVPRGGNSCLVFSY